MAACIDMNCVVFAGRIAGKSEDKAAKGAICKKCIDTRAGSPGKVLQVHPHQQHLDGHHAREPIAANMPASQVYHQNGNLQRNKAFSTRDMTCFAIPSVGCTQLAQRSFCVHPLQNLQSRHLPGLRKRSHLQSTFMVKFSNIFT